MSARVLLRERPSRAIALVTSTHALIFRHSPSTTAPQSTATPLTPAQTPASGASGTPSPTPQRCIVELAPLEKIDQNDYRNINNSVHGTLGLITIDNDVFLSVVSNATKVATVRPGETVQRILTADFRKSRRSAPLDFRVIGNGLTQCRLSQQA